MIFNSFAGTPVVQYATKTQLENEVTERMATEAELQGLINNNTIPPLPSERFQATLTLCGNSDTPQWGLCHYAEGDIGPAGGKVFRITDNGLHGLEVAPVDLFAAIWGCKEVVIGTSVGTDIGTGKKNTLDILAGCDQANIAAKIADDYTLNDYADWYLPSIDELQLLYQQEHLGGGLAGSYWSSTESDSAKATALANGKPHVDEKDSVFRVRAVREF